MKLTTSSAFQVQPDVTYALSHPRRSKWNLLTAILAGFGYLGTIASLISLYQPACQMRFVLLVAVVSFLSAVGIQFFPRHGGHITAVCLMAVLTVLLIRMNQAVAGIQHLVNAVYQTAYHTDISYFKIQESYDALSSITLVSACLVALLALFFAFFTIRRSSFWMTAGISFLLLESGLYLGLPVNPLAIAPLLAYWCGMLALKLAVGRLKHSSAVRNNAAVCGTFTAWAVLLIYGAVALLGSFSGYTRTEADLQRRRELSDSLSAFDIQNIPDSVQELGAALGIGNSSKISRIGTKSKVTFRDKTELTVSFNTLPNSAMYLKGYVGSVYTDNSWRPLPDDTDARDADVVSDVIGTYDCVPQNYPFLFQRSLLPDAETFQCTITPEKWDSRYYQPYVSFSDTATYTSDTEWTPEERDSYSWTVSAPQSWVIPTLANTNLQESTFSPADLGADSIVQEFLRALQVSDSDDISIQTRFSPSQAAETPEQIQGKVIPAMLMESLVYRGFVKDADTVLPDEPALQDVYDALPAEIAEQRPETPEEQYTALCAIRDWLAQQATYTTSPGKTPRGREFVSFFLLENHKGYCVHYATAGAILARYLGIPARYCEGYLVGDDMLQQAETTSGGYSVALTDRQAHAWCEFYIDGYGWMPFEMTPGVSVSSTAESTATATTPETTTTATTLATEATESNTKAVPASSTARTTVAQSVTNTSADLSDGTSGTEKSGLSSGIQHMLVVIVLLVLLLAACALVRYWHISLRKRRLADTKNPKQAVLTAYHYLLQLLRFCGMPYDGQLLMTYCVDAEKYLTAKKLPSEAVEQIIPLTLAVDLGQKTPTTAEQLAAKKAVLDLAHSIYTSCNPLVRICMKCGLHLI